VKFQNIADDVKLGENVKIFDFVNLYGCELGDNTKVGTFVEIQRGAKIGKNCKISSHTFICEGVTIEDNVFIGHNVTFINDIYPRATTADGKMQTADDWKCIPTLIKKGASIGSSTTLLCGIIVGENAIVGAGSVVTKDVPPNTIVLGNPTRVLRKIEEEKNKMKVPFLDLKAQYNSLKDEIGIALQEVMHNTAFAGGKYVAQFEQEFADYSQTDFAIAVNSGTSALWLALLAIGVGKGDEVITVPNTFIATAEAISFCGAKPVFVDIDEKTYNMNPELIEAAITERTKAIIPVHLFGQPADMEPILAIAKKHELYVVEDACQAHGAEFKGKRVGSMGDAGCFSFYPGKNLGAYGEGGAVITNNAEIDEKIRMLRDHGQSKKYYHAIIGWNARMDGFQGAVLNVKLKHLAVWNEGRRNNAMLYNKLLKDVEGIITPEEADYARHIYHVYAIRVQNRDQLMDYLKQKEIFCGIHYPIPIHLQQAFQSLGSGEGTFPVAEQCANEFVSLPMFPELADEQIEYTVEQINKFMGS